MELIEITSVCIWIIFLKLIQTAVYPYTEKCFANFGYAVSYPISLLLFTLASWYCALIGIPLYVSLVPFAALLIYAGLKREYSIDEFRRNLIWDFVFLVLFLLMLEVKYLNPAIALYGEKFMDHAILASIINNPVIPPVDPWYASGTLNVYYYLGYWIFGSAAHILGIESVIMFNLVLPTVFAFAGIMLYACGRLFLTRFRWLPAAALFAVNPAFIYLIPTGTAVSSIFWDSTRIIENCINEYPLFSMLWGDVHPHVISLFNQVLLIFILSFIYLKWHEMSEYGKTGTCLCAALSLGSMPLINTWDVLVYAPVLLIFGILTAYKGCRRTIGSGFSLRDLISNIPWRMVLMAPVLAILIYLPFYFMLNSAGITGVGIVQDPTELLPFILAYGIFLVILYLETARDIIRRPYLILPLIPFVFLGYTGAGLCMIPAAALLVRLITQRDDKTPANMLAFAGIILIAVTELIYLQDSMGDTYPRMNTVFKFAMIAWMMLSVSCFTYAGGWLGRFCENHGFYHSSDGHGSRLAAALFIIALLIIIPLLAPVVSYGYPGGSLNGIDWIKNSYPDDYNGICYLRGVDPADISGIAEAEDGDYKYASRISSMTGLPTVIGMPFHEVMWRADTNEITQRMNDVRRIYEDPVSAPELMKKYGMTHLFLGLTENERYNVNLAPEFREVFRSGNTAIYVLDL